MFSCVSVFMSQTCLSCRVLQISCRVLSCRCFVVPCRFLPYRSLSCRYRPTHFVLVVVSLFLVVARRSCRAGASPVLVVPRAVAVPYRSLLFLVSRAVFVPSPSPSLFFVLPLSCCPIHTHTHTHERPCCRGGLVRFAVTFAPPTPLR